MIEQARDLFIKKYQHLWYTQVPGGINNVGIGATNISLDDEPVDVELGITVSIESSDEVYDAVPGRFMGFPVYKEIVGKKR